ncbi:uncharacterized protein CXQ87_001092 [Candidozyma duobushaemuli]|uniref:Bromo domain-containing protein n=2 Tax=Candidozyma TaxID=3303203 RepID=A0ABX8I2S7_9ASCO|nr:uncharacterized protein CXQ87_001092 [[Candida] duobushaemulonis]PVH18175.1 hypothetical protein CXQ87_001092 [[Candida] duobushaemulonis]QWU86739.1 hypothetical protein CA3LBN_000957 [[Candida] haemuloni]
MPRVKRAAAGDHGAPKRHKGQSAEDFFKSVLEEIEGLQDDNGERALVTAFVKLPSKKLYPDYYTLIDEPISLNEINKKVARGTYENAQDFVSDFNLMYENASKYNDPESWIVADAKKLLEYVTSRADQFAESSSSITVADLPKIADDILEEVIAHEFPEDGVLSGPFMEVVDPDEYPDYYKLIEQPTSFSDVKNSLTNGLFDEDKSLEDNLQAFYDATVLIFTNAQTFNDPSSLIYEDARKLREVFEEKFNSLKQEAIPQSKLKLKVKAPKEPMKLKLNLKSETPQPQKKKRGRKSKKVLQEEEEARRAADGDSGIKQEDSDTEEGEDEDEDAKHKLDATESNVMGKTPITPSSDEVFIRGATFSSSHSATQQIATSLAQQGPALITPAQNYKRDMFPDVSVLNAATLFQYKFGPIGYSTKAYTINLPAEASSFISLKVSLHEFIYNLKKKDLVGGQGILKGNAEEDFSVALFINDDKVSGCEIYEEEDPLNDAKSLLGLQFELKLSYGLNIINFELRLSPNLAKSLRKDEPEPENDLGSRHTRHQLQQIKLNWEVEKFQLMVNCHNP